MFGWFKRKSLRPDAATEPQVLVFLNPLVMLLAGRERQKGSPLTREEVLEVRDTAPCIRMPKSQAEKVYASLDSHVPIPRIDPERCWEEWQEIRQHLQY
jgi:hypothetical protein